MRESIIWIVGVLIFIAYRLFNSSLATEGTVLGGMMLAISIFWYIVPFLLGRNMTTLGSATIVFIKGEDNLARLISFLIGIAVFIVSLIV